MELLIILLLLINVNGKYESMFNLPPKPDRCNRPAEFMYRQCCLFPPFFTRDVAVSCGSMTVIMDNDDKANYTTFIRTTVSNCLHWRCVLRKYYLLDSNGIFDDNRYFAHLDRWVDMNPAFKTVIKSARVFCRNGNRMRWPLKVCEFYDFNMCIRNYVTKDCPATIASKECLEQKEFYDECREFYL